MNTEPRTEAGRELLANDSLWFGDDASDILAIEAQARAELLTTLESEVAGLPEPTLGLKGGVNREAVQRLLSKHRDSIRG